MTFKRAVLEAELENPSGGAPFILRQNSHPNRAAYTFQSPPLEGIETGRDYGVEPRLIEGAERRVIARYSRGFQSELAQAVLPKRPLAVGPGYHPPADKATDRD